MFTNSTVTVQLEFVMAIGRLKKITNITVNHMELNQGLKLDTD